METDQNQSQVRRLIPIGMIVLAVLLALIGIFNFSGRSDGQSSATQLEQQALRQADERAGFASDAPAK